MELFDGFHPDLDRFARGIIRRKARQLIGRVGFTKHDREDIEQELTLHLLRRFPAYNSSRSHPFAFIVTIIERCVANILRDRQAQKRDPRRTVSQTGLPDPTESLCQHGRSSRDAAEMAQLAQDVADVLDRLPDNLRQLAESLKKQTIAEAARSWGIPRTTLYTLVRQLRKKFEQADLHKYFE